MKKIIVLISVWLLSITVSSAIGRTEAILTQQMLDDAKTTFVVNKNYNLMGQTLVVPEGLSLSFSGGCMDHGELCGSNSKIEVNGNDPVFGLDIKISGIWDVPEVHDGWFAFDDSPDFVSNQIINNILSFSNDSNFCHIYFDDERTYYFELPYKGRADLGNMVSFRMVDGKKKRKYSDLLKDDYSFLRIFIIPSNTRLTVNNKLKMLPTNQGAYFIFWEYGKENITIDGTGTISGDNDWHLYDSPFLGKHYYGEWGHVFTCIRCKDFAFKDITLSDAFGDCLYYSGSQYSDEANSRWASNLTIDNVTILRARRNGIAVGARHVRINNCHFEGCGIDSVKGTAPKSAIDFEPDNVQKYPSIGNQDVIMEKCSFINNYFDVASSVNNLPGFSKMATTIKNCHFNSGVKISSTYWMRFENCYIPFMFKMSDNKQYYSKHIEFVNCEFKEDDEVVMGLFSNKTNKFINCRFTVEKSNSTE